jgi:hypothetical protein
VSFQSVVSQSARSYDHSPAWNCGTGIPMHTHWSSVHGTYSRQPHDLVDRVAQPHCCRSALLFHCLCNGANSGMSILVMRVRSAHSELPGLVFQVPHHSDRLSFHFWSDSHSESHLAFLSFRLCLHLTSCVLSILACAFEF